MNIRFRRWSICLGALSGLYMFGCQGIGTPSPSTPAASSYQLTATAPAAGAGTITSSPSGINCPGTCTASFSSGTKITLTATSGNNYFFSGWSGACSGPSTCQLTLTASETVAAAFTPGETLTVTTAGGGTGTVTSSPSGIDCASGSTTKCSASFPKSTAVTLSQVPSAPSTFSGWSGGCQGNSSCKITLSAASSVTATFAAPGSLESLNHIIIFAQENRSFDHYFGYMRAYWKAKGIPDQSFDGLPLDERLRGSSG